MRFTLRTLKLAGEAIAAAGGGEVLLRCLDCMAENQPNQPSRKPSRKPKRKPKPEPESKPEPIATMQPEPVMQPDPIVIEVVQPTPRKCEYCGGPIQGRAWNSPTCSEDCRVLLKDLKAATKREARLAVDLNCEACGVPIQAEKFAGKPPKFCPECRKIRNRENWQAYARITDGDLRTWIQSRADEVLPSIPTGPTDARPGDPEKVLVLAARAAKNLPLWNPHDETTAGREADKQWML